MLGATHIITGALVGAAMQHPVGAVAGGIASHYLIDAIPHWDYAINRIRTHKRISRETVVDFLKIAFDNGAGFLVVYVMFEGTPLLWYGLIGGFFGLLPDVLWGLSLFVPNRLLRWHYRFHEFVHAKTHLSLPAPSLLAQAAIVVLLTIITPR